jgi:transcriptional regulator with XRE-family HTH domain
MDSFGQSLKQWRQQRKVSQLELSLVADVSTKHISFLETGKSQPSREMVLHLSEALDIPLAERNFLLKQSGFTEVYPQCSLNTQNMEPVYKALELMLENHNPFPAMVLDWDWNILMTNAAQQKLTSLVCSNPGFPDTENLMELIFHPYGFRPFITNWEVVAFHLLQRLKKENSLSQNRHADLINRLLSFPGIPSTWSFESSAESALPVLTINLTVGDLSLSLFSTLTTFGTPIDVTVQEMTIEQYFPSDETTREFFISQLGTTVKTGNTPGASR